METTYSTIYESATDFDITLQQYDFRALRPFLKGPAVLEMGCGRGETTRMLAEIFPHLHVVDASRRCIELASVKVPETARFFQGFFEEFEPPCRYDSILLLEVLEHLEDPVLVLKRAASWLNPGGTLHIMVPHARSLHRRLGVAMGLLPAVDALNDRDRQVGHRRVYTLESLLAEVNDAGLQVARHQGIFLKILSNAQMENLDPKLIEALFVVGHELPDFCSTIYVSAELV
ncbi:MAG: class I SAM-dependent methyltransferase [Acidobacteria bacterium]|nr:class I SAM-dependent methyltransferase [Acidobacteriota bacterium]